MQVILFAVSGLSPQNAQDDFGLMLFAGIVWAIINWLFLVIATSLAALLFSSFGRRPLITTLASWLGAAFVSIIFTIIVLMVFMPSLDSRPFKEGGDDCPRIVQTIASVAPSAGVVVGAYLGQWLVVRRRGRRNRW